MTLRLAAIMLAIIGSTFALHRVRADSPLPKSSAKEDANRAAASEENEKEKDHDTVPEAKQLPWTLGLEEGLERARREGRPALVRFEGAFCPWCVKLDEEIKRADVQTELKRWTLIVVPIEKFPDDAERLTVGPIPALRVLTQRGTLVASHDGFLPADEFIAWIGEQHQRAAAMPDDVLSSDGAPSLTDVVRLARLLGQRDQALREAAIRRMLPFPAPSAALVVQSLEEGKLSTKLSALELLSAWKAPVEGLDPWRPATITPRRMAKLNEWASQLPAAPPDAPQAAAMSDDDRRAALAELSRLETALSEEAARISERLARHSAALLPEVRQRLQIVENDEARERLTALRYRLASSNALELNWPGGIARLASRRTEDRHQALKDLLARATGRDETLLLELFSDADPLMRELSLRGLQKVSGSAASAGFVKLLDDPDPNVQAAVLKQLVESPDASFIPHLAEYLSHQKDPDLVTHAVRVLSETKSAAAVPPLVAMLKHESWQVRAEAAEALGNLLSDRSLNGKAIEKTADAYAALVECLSDEDGFVVARVMEAVAKANLDLPEAVAPAVALAQRNPELAVKAIEFVVSKPAMRAKASGNVADFLKHKNANVRIAVIRSLSSAMSQPDATSQRYLDAFGDLRTLMQEWLSSDDRNLRMAAADELFEIQNQERRKAFSSLESQARASHVHHATVRVAPPRSTTSIIVEGLSAIFGGSTTKPADNQKPQPEKGDAGDKETEDKEKSAKPSGDEDQMVDAPAAPWEEWVLKYRKGKGRPDWMDELDKPLEKMLASKDAAERLAAAMPLIALGNVEKPLKLLPKLTKKDPSVVDKASAALAWTLWDDRAKLFKALLEQKPDPSEYYQLIQNFSAIPDPRAADLLWEVVESGPNEVASTLNYTFPKLYFGQRYYDPSQIPASAKRHVLEVAATHINVKKPAATMLALNLIATADKDEAEQRAASLVTDESASPELRADALRMELLNATPAAATRRSVELISDKHDALRRVALRYLAQGSEGINSVLDGHVHLSVHTFNAWQSGTPIVVESPKGLTVEAVTPLLDDADEDTVAMAEYLLVVFGKTEHLVRLIAHWREKHHDDNEWHELIYRAIAAADDESHLPVLREIYAKLNSYEMNKFYWTIRTMTGSQLLAFRKQIRNEKNIFGN